MILELPHHQASFVNRSPLVVVQGFAYDKKLDFDQSKSYLIDPASLKGSGSFSLSKQIIRKSMFSTAVDSGNNLAFLVPPKNSLFGLLLVYHLSC
jgi:hypothetical protein